MSPEPTGEFQAREVERFGFLAIPSPGQLKGLEGPLCIADGLWFLPRAPIVPDGFWREAVGNQTAKALALAPFWIVTTREAPHEGRTVANDDPMVATLHDFLESLLMSGFPGFGIKYPAQSFLGTVIRLRSTHHVSTFRFGTAYPMCPDTTGILINPDTLRSAERRLPLYYAVRSGQNMPWSRVNRGLHMLSKAMQEVYAEFRIHHYVQAIEALIKPCKGDNRVQFRERCRPFTCPCASRDTILGDIYDIRSAVEHMHDWTSPLHMATADKRDERAKLRLWQAENLALHTYACLLESAQLLEQFRNDQIDATWNAKPCPLETLWTQKLDLEWCRLKARSSGRSPSTRGRPGSVLPKKKPGA